MSRLGRRPIPIPPGVTVTLVGGHLEATGPKGTVAIRLPRDVVVEAADSTVTLRPASGKERARGVSARWGTTSALIRNALSGAAAGFEKKLELHGVGYRAEVTDRTLHLSVGFSHPVEVEAPEGIIFSVEKNIITVAGVAKDAVGEIAAAIRRVRPPEPYKGKGIRYVGEVVRRKAGKVAGTTTA